MAEIINMPSKDQPLDIAKLKAAIEDVARRQGDGDIDESDAELELIAIQAPHKKSIQLSTVRLLYKKAIGRYKVKLAPNGGAVSAPEDPAVEYAAAYELCHELLTDPNLIGRFLDVVERQGVIGDKAGSISILLTAASRLSDDPAGLLRKGASSGGKNHPIEKGVLPLLNEGADYIRFTSASAKALYYSDFDFRHKLIVVAEAAALAETKNGGNDEQAMAVREFISSGRLDYETVQRDEDGRLQGVHIRKDGPVAIVVTTARDNVEEELGTRLLTTLVDESDAQTKRVLNAQARRAAGDGPAPVSEEELEKWRALQTCLRLGPRDIVIPFATIIAELTERRQMRIRRDLRGLFSLTKASALLHRYQRKVDAQGRIIAELWDYGLALRALGEGPEELAHGETAPIEAVRVAVSEALRDKRQEWRRGLFMSAFREALCKHLAGTRHIGLVQRLAHARQHGQGDTVDECLEVVTKTGAPIDQQTRSKLYREAAVTSCQEARKPGVRPDRVELSTRKLAVLLGIGHKAARIRLEDALEAGAVLDVSPSDKIRPRTAPRWLTPGAPVKPASASRTGPFPSVSIVQQVFLSPSTPGKSGHKGTAGVK